MANKISNIGFDQIPHVVMNHPETDPYHYVIMTALFKILKDNECCTYSNFVLAKNTKIPDRTIRKKLNDLEEWLFIKRVGNGYSRKFYLGLAFDIEQIKFNSATVAGFKSYNPAPAAGFKLHNPAAGAVTPAVKGQIPGTSGRQSNRLLKTITKGIILNSSSTPTPEHPAYTKEQEELVQAYKHGLKYPEMRLNGIELQKAKTLYDRHNK
jgi:hypothetical protein